MTLEHPFTTLIRDSAYLNVVHCPLSELNMLRLIAIDLIRNCPAATSVRRWKQMHTRGISLCSALHETEGNGETKQCLKEEIPPEHAIAIACHRSNSEAQRCKLGPRGAATGAFSLLGASLVFGGFILALVTFDTDCAASSVIGILNSKANGCTDG